MIRRRITAENAEYQIIQSLKGNRVKRNKHGEIFIEGIEAFKQALAARVEITRIIVSDGKALSDWAKSVIAGNADVPVIEMAYDLYKALCDREEPNELVATAKKRDATLAGLVLPEKPFVLMFDRPSDYGNFGSIIRSADSFGVDAVFVIGHSIDWLDPKAIRSSLGAIFHVPVVQVESMQELQAWIATQKRKNGMVVFGTDSTGESSLLDTAPRRPVSIILGNEAKGMSVALKTVCDSVVRIPLRGSVNSLNVSCAGSILLWEAFKNSGDR